MKIHWKPLIISLLISLGTGTLAGILTKNSVRIYSELPKPDFSPPGFIFPIVWTVLYLLMGISAYLVFCSNSKNRTSALFFYFLQLAVNFLWPFIFFNLQQFTFAFVWIILLFVLVVIMIAEMYKVDKTAAYLQIPYLLWLLYAMYLNFNVAKALP